MCEGVGDRTELQHIDPHSYGHQRFFGGFFLRSTGLLNRGPGAKPLWVLVFSTASYLYLVWFPNCLNFLCTELYNSSTPTQSIIGYRNSSTPTQSITGYRNMHFRRLWNDMFDRHRAEITGMQFTGHSLPVHQFVTVPWDFNPVPYCQPSSPTPTEYATSALFGMACLAGSEVNILHNNDPSTNYFREAEGLLSTFT